MKGIRANGVPKGTRWANTLLGVFKLAKIMWPIHKGRARASVKVKWLEAVKVKGESPRKLFKAIKRNKLKETKRIPGTERGFIEASNSALIWKIVFFKSNKGWFLINQKEEGRKNSTKLLEAQFNGKEK